MLSSTRLLLVVIFAALATTVKAALPEKPISMLMTKSTFSSASNIPVLNLPALEMAQLRSSAFSSGKSAIAQPLTFAKAHQQVLDSQILGEWETTQFDQEGVTVWRYKLVSPNAYSLNLGFSKFKMPEGGRLYIYGENYQNLVGPFTEKDNEDHGELWTPVVDGRTLIIEVNVPLGKKGQLELELKYINQAFLDFKNLSAEQKALKSGSCNVDVVCPQSAGWGDQIRSVAAFTISGTSTCSGAAINNASSQTKPYFLTANHCGLSSSNAPSMVAYWNYQNSFCRTPGSFQSGLNGDGSFSQFNSGAIFRASFSTSDFALVEFDDPILASANVYLAGWSRSNSAPSSAVAIHHPQVEEKRISFENDATTITGYLGAPGSGDTHIRVFDWDLGTTEPGSSGSPLFDSNRRIVGQLHGGFAACGNNDEDWYGRIYRSWTGGGSSFTRLSNWLDPNASGVYTLNGRNYNSTTPPPEPENPNIVPQILLLLDD